MASLIFFASSITILLEALRVPERTQVCPATSQNSHLMAGHSKWSKVKRFKGALDTKRGALFSKLFREITIAAKTGGGGPDGNARLRSAIFSARGQRMPNDNIERPIKRGTGQGMKAH